MLILRRWIVVALLLCVGGAATHAQGKPVQSANVFTGVHHVLGFENVKREAKGTLTVEVHRLGSPLQDAAVTKLCEQLTATQTTFPTTSLRLIYRQVGST